MHLNGLMPPRAIPSGNVWILLFTWTLLFSLPGPAFSQSYDKARLRMVEDQLKSRDITDPRVLEIMGRVPRHLFVPGTLAREAYNDHPLPIGEGQTISQPYVVALMTQELRLKPTDVVLEIGTGSGYQAAVLGEITQQVYSIEIRPGLAKQARERLRGLEYGHIRVKQGDGYFGWPEQGPFDAIIITAAVNHIPPPLIQQLKKGGSLILPLGSTVFFQTLTRVTKQQDDTLEVEHLTSVRFVPMTGEAQKRH
jgi:protein-L-isoaspartate(D-aspartate) O-methyltransferase